MTHLRKWKQQCGESYDILTMFSLIVVSTFAACEGIPILDLIESLNRRFGENLVFRKKFRW